MKDFSIELQFSGDKVIATEGGRSVDINMKPPIDRKIVLAMAHESSSLDEFIQRMEGVENANESTTPGS